MIHKNQIEKNKFYYYVSTYFTIFIFFYSFPSYSTKNVYLRFITIQAFIILSQMQLLYNHLDSKTWSIFGLVSTGNSKNREEKGEKIGLKNLAYPNHSLPFCNSQFKERGKIKGKKNQRNLGVLSMDQTM